MPEVRANGVSLYYEEHGEGRPIVCIHGTSGSAAEAFCGCLSPPGLDRSACASLLRKVIASDLN